MLETDKKTDPSPAGTPDPADRPVVAQPRHQRPHDFRKPRVLSDERLRALETIHRKFSRNLSSVLSTMARLRVSVDFVSVTQKTYFDFIRSLANPTALCLVYHMPQRLPFVLELSPGTLFPLITRLLGGKEETPPAPTRPLTRIEQELAKTIAGHVLRALEPAWLPAISPTQQQDPSPGERCTATQLDLAEIEHNPLLMQIIGPAEPAVVLQFQVSLGQTSLIQSPFHICLPSKPFETVLAQLTRSAIPGSSSERNTPEERERILARVDDTSLEVTVELASVPITLPDALSLRPGDVLELGQDRGGEVAVMVDGRRAFRGQPSMSNGRRAVRITKTVNES